MDTVTLTITLEATVNTESWAATYGTNAGVELPDHLAHDAMYAPRLLTLIHPAETADVRLREAQTLTPRIPGYTRMSVMLDVTLDATAWRTAYGTDPYNAVGAHIAAELDTASPMRNEVTGTVIFHPTRTIIRTKS